MVRPERFELAIFWFAGRQHFSPSHAPPAGVTRGHLKETPAHKSTVGVQVLRYPTPPAAEGCAHDETAIRRR